ncbi:raptor N-terminal caspase like domain-containing protein [Polychytrium aggregatum]|uniref:raptor N-terminal caspase like domain-containing protein n=1 Tax=Polychytrium aggregatum TaxID=110093 RepID=UPI0022FF08C6|nr:raptor N-terminal caspase like domain-containing protein [Polychytrium aggregatum]KAI9205108.1 raptor N-terminal caspase like domain-containing protein [Polychytrium aggregatum]
MADTPSAQQNSASVLSMPNLSDLETADLGSSEHSPISGDALPESPYLDSPEEQPYFTYSYYTERRHESHGAPTLTHPCRTQAPTDWRMKERLKTVSVALVICLNIGVDPPDVVKTNPCAKMECWVDPFSLPPPRALESIGRNLQQQYEVWQPRSRYRLSLDPSIEETKRLCLSLRRNAREERILFHYNGHGVPKPTPGGEIWVFNRNYTQYIPISIYDIQTWLGSPCIYVYDCSNAGNILQSFNRFAEQRDTEALRQAEVNGASNNGAPPTPYVPMRDCIQLAACGPNEILPMNPELPADIFTCCLTTPIEIGLRWFVSNNPLLTNITPDMIMKIPGRLNDRRTPLGELNWIFTAITDTIAWIVLPHDLFKTLFRQDLMVAAMFRNFLLADRIMRSYHCTPQSSPSLPPTHQHPMWEAWDLAADMCLSQLPDLLAQEENGTAVEYQSSTFFADQLTAFEVWLTKGAISREPPEQLPIVLQVLLSQAHRLRALMLLSKFLDLGPWAVNLALSVGIFPYVLKLLQSPAGDLKSVLVFIWAKILAVDRSCQNDLLKDNGFTYFLSILVSHTGMPLIPNISEHRAMCAFILSVFCHNFRSGQQACLRSDLLPSLSLYLVDPDPLLRQWSCICLGKMWQGYSEAKRTAVSENVHEKLAPLLLDHVAEVRAAALFAFGTLLDEIEGGDPVITVDVGTNIGISILVATSDASHLVRNELVVTLSHYVQHYHSKFVNCALEMIEDDRKRFTEDVRSQPNGRRSASLAGIDWRSTQSQFKSPSHNSIYGCIWKVLLALTVDPFEGIARKAIRIVDQIHLKLARSHSLELPLHGPGAVLDGLQAPSPLPLSRSSTIYQSSAAKESRATLKRSTSFVHYLTGRGASSENLPGELNGSANLAQGPASSGTNPPPSPWLTAASNLLVAGERRSRAGAETPPPSSHSRPGSRAPSPVPGSGADALRNLLENPSFEIDTVSLESEFFEWSCESFAEPQIRMRERDDAGSDSFNERQWRKQRNDKVVAANLPFYETSGTRKFEECIKMITTEQPPTLLRFHQFEQHLAYVDERNIVSVYDWEENVKLSSFSNKNPAGSRITSLRFINEEDYSLLFVGSSEGVVRIYRNYEEKRKYELATSWRALTDLFPESSGPGLISDWQQHTGLLSISGESKFIRIWDAYRETCVRDISTQTGQPVTSLASNRQNPFLVIAGFNDGAIRLYDRRQSGTDCLVHTISDHRQRILSTIFHHPSEQLISASASGEVRLWDLRSTGATAVLEGAGASDMSAFAVHEQAPLIVRGSASHTMCVQNIEGQILSQIRYHEGYILGQKPGAINHIDFHPHSLVFAASAAGTNSISIYGSELRAQ